MPSDGGSMEVMSASLSLSLMGTPTPPQNWTLGNLLRALVIEHDGGWDSLLPRAEFAYNSAIHSATGKSPYELVFGRQPRQPLDLLPSSRLISSSPTGVDFAQYMSQLHRDIQQRLITANANTKPAVDQQCWRVDFQPGDLVMIRLRADRFPQARASKLSPRAAGPFRILKRLGANASVDIPTTWATSDSFNVCNLVPYRAPLQFLEAPFPTAPLAHPAAAPATPVSPELSPSLARGIDGNSDPVPELTSNFEQDPAATEDSAVRPLGDSATALVPVADRRLRRRRLAKKDEEYVYF